MSVLNKIKEITEKTENLTKEKPVVTIISDCCMQVENYRYLRLFADERIIVELDEFELDITGTSLLIKFFSPSRIILEGEIRTITYSPERYVLSEEL